MKGKERLYLLRVDEFLWRRVKSKAALEGLRVREVIEGLLNAWLDGEVKINKMKGGD